MYTEVECVFVNKATPSLTNVVELAPQKSVIPIQPRGSVFIPSIVVEYTEEYIIVELMDSTGGGDQVAERIGE